MYTNFVKLFMEYSSWNRFVNEYNGGKETEKAKQIDDPTKCGDNSSCNVCVYIYKMSIPGFKHASIVLFDTEWHFDDGVIKTIPTKSYYDIKDKESDDPLIGTKFHKRYILGACKPGITNENVTNFIDVLSKTSFAKNTYDLFKNNCCHFVNTVCMYATGKQIPGFMPNIQIRGGFISRHFPGAEEAIMSVFDRD